jgi:hypothetical protein
MTFSRRKTTITLNHYFPFNGQQVYGLWKWQRLFNSIFRQAFDILPQKQGGWHAPYSQHYDLYQMYSAKDTVRRKATIMLNGDLYPELNAAGGGYKANQVRA